jgi:tetratricopeptide (TPR) repeat protein/predicted Ser/Thr protein kinase
MECPVCQADNAPSAATCEKCSTPLPLSDATISPSGYGQTAGWSAAATVRPASSAAAKGQLEPGSTLGDRYEILQLLGQGGMGAVYKARDIELDRMVALKLIRPDLASHPEILRRFKQELILAREVTHRNVIRIYDLGQASGLRYITMEYVEGRDLRAVLREKGKLTPEEAVPMFRQIAAALEAAHHAGVVHRDLKPQNILVDKDGRVYVMDFGVARSLETPGMTQTGALMGTPEYMSPEQAKGMKVDARSDLFSLGIIFYEMLSSVSPFKAETAMATMFKRTQVRAVPLSESGVPVELSDIVAKCLEIDPEKRFGSAREVAQQLEIWQGSSAGSSVIILPTRRTAPYWKWASAALAILLIATVIGFRVKGPPKPKAAHAPVSVLVADFTNHTGDPIFDDTLEPMFNVALEGASFVNAYSRGTARKLAQKLPHPTDKLDEQSARLVAVSQGIGAVVTGELSRRGDKYSLSAVALDSVTGNVLARAEVTAASKDEVLGTIAKLAAPIRKALGDVMPESAQLETARGTLTASSLEAVHQYGIAMEQQAAGRREEALASFARTAELDSGFARAYSGMAASSMVLNKLQDAEKYMKLAMQHEDRMTDRERYRVRGLYYFVEGNYQKCVEEYSELVSRYPADNIGQGNLAGCYVRLRNVPKAVEAARRAVEIVPKYAVRRLYLSFYTSYGGDFQGGEREARAALALSPSPEGYLALAEAQVGEGQLSQAAETYKSMEKVSALGASTAASGLADIELYEGRFTEAMRKLERGATVDVAAKKPENAADKLVMLGYIQLLRRESGAAAVAADKALADSQSVKVRFLAAQVFAEAGQGAKAQKLANGLASELQAEPQAYSKIIGADLAAKEGNALEAIKALMEANTLLDSWIGHFELGRAYLDAGLLVEADSEFDRCVKRRGEALELFMDNVPTFGYFPPVYYYQGRVREGLKSAGFAESYRNYLSIRGKAAEDPLLPEIRRRLGQ